MVFLDTTLEDTEDDVNNGTPVKMNCVDIAYAWDNFIQIPSVPGKSPLSGTHQTLLPEGDTVGFSSPIITLQGVIDVEDTTNNRITLLLLQQFAKSGNVLVLSDKYEGSKFRISGMKDSFPDENITTIRCIVANFTARASSQVNNGRRLDYTMVLREVQ